MTPQALPGELVEAARTIRDDPKIRKAAAAVVLAGLVAYAAAGWKGVLVLGVALVIGAAYRPLRQRAIRWYLLG